VSLHDLGFARRHVLQKCRARRKKLAEIIFHSGRIPTGLSLHNVQPSPCGLRLGKPMSMEEGCQVRSNDGGWAARLSLETRHAKRGGLLRTRDSLWNEVWHSDR
jgi:hypothetical protein